MPDSPDFPDPQPHEFDPLVREIADYVCDARLDGAEAYQTARLCLADSMGCAMAALRYARCRRLIGPVVEGAVMPGGARVPGTRWTLDPPRAAYSLGVMIRWLGYNDTFLYAEWGHPSDNLGALLTVADYVSRHPKRPIRRTVGHLLTAMIKTYEVHGGLAMLNAFNRVGLDHVLLVRVASAAVATHLFGGDRRQIAAAVSNAWLDGGALRAYRHAGNTGPRKRWAAGDAASRGVFHALQSLRGEPGYPTGLSEQAWGFLDVLFDGREIELAQPLGSYVIENVLFKVAAPGEYHGLTAVEAAVQLHPQVVDRIADVERVVIHTHEAAIRIIDKSAPLRRASDRDHCLQYMTAVGLVFGEVRAEHYEDAVAADPRIDALRSRMQVFENENYTRYYNDPAFRSIANAVQVEFRDGTSTERVEVRYPIGHRRRRDEARPMLRGKFRQQLRTVFDDAQAERIEALFDDPARLDETPIDQFIGLFVPDDDPSAQTG